MSKTKRLWLLISENELQLSKGLIQQVKYGSKEKQYKAYIEFEKLYKPRILKYTHNELTTKWRNCKNLPSNARETDELVQDVFTAFYTKINEIDINKNFMGLLINIWNNEVNSEHKIRGRYISKIIYIQECYKLISNKEFINNVFKLSKLQKHIIQERLKGSTYKQIALKIHDDITSLKRNMFKVKSELRRAANKLKSFGTPLTIYKWKSEFIKKKKKLQ